MRLNDEQIRILQRLVAERIASRVSPNHAALRQLSALLKAR
jgi:hypothetical protein